MRMLLLPLLFVVATAAQQEARHKRNDIIDFFKRPWDRYKFQKNGRLAAEQQAREEAERTANEARAREEAQRQAQEETSNRLNEQRLREEAEARLKAEEALRQSQLADAAKAAEIERLEKQRLHDSLVESGRKAEIEAERVHFFTLTMILVFVALAFLLIAILMAILLWCYRRVRDKADYITQAGILIKKFTLTCGAPLAPELLGERESLLGLGHYGKVYLRPLRLENEAILTACKEIRAEHIENYKDAYDDVLAEVQLMHKLSHPNVVRLLGFTVEGESMPILITEYMANGSLHEYLRNPKNTQFIEEVGSNEEISLKQPALLTKLMRFAKEAAEGMLYLHRFHIIHRDLAARNCLLDGRNTLHIADFGLARRFETYTGGYMHKNKSKSFDLLCAPIEVLNGQRFTIEGDVWSYGILVWEIFSLGETPYGATMSTDSGGTNGFGLVNFLSSGQRLTKPEKCPGYLFRDMIEQCWMSDPKLRPDFGIICAYLRKVEMKSNHHAFQDRRTINNALIDMASAGVHPSESAISTD